MASITKRGKTWSARVSYYKNAERLYLNHGGFRTKREAQQWADENELAVRNGDNIKEGSQLFTDYFLKWYQTYKEPTMAKSTRLRYQYTIGIVNAYFAGKKLNAITRMDYQQFLNDYGNPADGRQRSISSSEKINTQIKAAVHYALDDGLIRRDFTAHTKISGRPGKPKEMKYLDASDTEKLTRALEADITFAHTTKLMALVALQTGMRYSEVGGLTWDCFSENFKTLRVNKTWQRNSEKDITSSTNFGDTKNPQSKRLIKITDHLADILSAFHQTQILKLNELEIENPLNLIFINQYGRVPDDASANQTLHRLLKRIGSKDITFHGLRHTHASYLIYKGVSIYYISERLGHANYSTTIRVYSHLLREMEDAETAKAIVALNAMDGSVHDTVHKNSKNA